MLHEFENDGDYHPTYYDAAITSASSAVGLTPEEFEYALANDQYTTRGRPFRDIYRQALESVLDEGD